MKFFCYHLAVLFFIFLTSSINGQESLSSLIDFAPDSNFISLKVKNAKDIRDGLENHPLKGLVYDDKTKEIMEELLEVFDKQDTDITIRNTQKRVYDKLFASFIGEIILTVSYHPKNDGKYDTQPKTIRVIIAHVDPVPFKAFIKAGIKYADTALGQKTVSTRAHDNIEYSCLEVEADLLGNAYATIVNGIGIVTNDEEALKKIMTAVSNKVAYVKGLKSNEKIMNYFKANESKDILFTADFTPFFKNESSTENVSVKKVIEFLCLDKVFQIYASYDMNEKGESFETSLNGLEEGFLQFLAFSNNEFTPSTFISTDYSIYKRAFFSLAELKKKYIDLATKVNPKFQETTYKDLFLDTGIETMLDSVGEDFEGFSRINNEGNAEGLFFNKLKNQSVFNAKFANIVNNATIKAVCFPSYTIAEKKEGSNQYWVFSQPSHDPNLKEDVFALGATATYAFVSYPANTADKHIGLIDKNTESKLSNLEVFKTTRTLYPDKVALFGFSSAKDMLACLTSKFKIDERKRLNRSVKLENAIILLNELNASGFTGSFSYALWKESNKISVSAKWIK